VAVLPFATRSDRDHAFLREALVELLSAKLHTAADLRSVDPRAILGDPSLRTAEYINPKQGGDLARRFGASLYILGSTVAVGDSFQISASLYRAGDGGEALAQATVRGAESQLLSLTDHLAAELIAAGTGTPATRFDRAASALTSSYGAARAYLEGEQAFRKARETLEPGGRRFSDAIAAFREAVKLDSTFALAYYRLAEASEWNNNAAATWQALASAERYQSGLPERHRLLVQAFAARLSCDAATAERLYRAVLETDPDEVEAWYGLGEVLQACNPQRGRSPLPAREAFEHVLRYDPDHWPSLLTLAVLAAAQRNFAAVDSLIERVYPGKTSPHWQILGRLASADSAQRQLLFASMARADQVEQAAGAYFVLCFLDDLDAARSLAMSAARSATAPDWRIQAYWTLASIELAQGRPRAARATLAQLAALDPGRAALLRALFATVPFAPAPRDEAEAARGALLKLGAKGLTDRVETLLGRPEAGVQGVIFEYLLGMLDIHLGQGDSALEHARRLEQLSKPRDVESRAHDLAFGIRARLKHRNGADKEALALLDQMGSQLPSQRRGSEVLGAADQRFEHAELLRALGEPQRALDWYASFGSGDMWYEAVYLAPVYLRTAEVLDERGDTDQALDKYRRFVARWRDAEPELQPRVEAARKRIVELMSTGTHLPASVVDPNRRRP